MKIKAKRIGDLQRQALAHAEENLINTNDQDGMLPAASCSHPVDSEAAPSVYFLYGENKKTFGIFSQRTEGYIHKTSFKLSDESRDQIIKLILDENPHIKNI